MEVNVMHMAFSYSGGEFTRKQIVQACIVFDLLKTKKAKTDIRDCARITTFMKQNKYLY